MLNVFTDWAEFDKSLEEFHIQSLKEILDTFTNYLALH